MLEGTNQSSTYTTELSCSGQPQCIYSSGKPYDWIILGYSVITQGHHMPRYTPPHLYGLTLVHTSLGSAAKPTQANQANLCMSTALPRACPTKALPPSPHTTTQKPYHKQSTMTTWPPRAYLSHSFGMELIPCNTTCPQRHAHSHRPRTLAQTAHSCGTHCHTLTQLSRPASAALLNSFVIYSVSLPRTPSSPLWLCRCTATVWCLHDIVPVLVSR